MVHTRIGARALAFDALWNLFLYRSVLSTTNSLKGHLKYYVHILRKRRRFVSDSVHKTPSMPIFILIIIPLSVIKHYNHSCSTISCYKNYLMDYHYVLQTHSVNMGDKGHLSAARIQTHLLAILTYLGVVYKLNRYTNTIIFKIVCDLIGNGKT